MPSAITMPAAAAAARLEARIDADQHQTVGSAAKIQGRTLSDCVVAAVRDGCAARHRAVRAHPPGLLAHPQRGMAHGAKRACAASRFHPDHRARMPITAALMIISVARAMLALSGRPLTNSSSAVDASGVM
ncbi:DUF1778 domain-containing protein [Verminephrobacter eiseniae]|nr:DUF1778 domain-containing protein [Verminephrobacter eiseniae]MCW5303264.1 DUF1778 domain-containing protein [Verminephrobacter eiseniae]MCW8178149.1 DUF1778 domain-containing protein [Verminephrobacter eiseniae]MCW8188657.1 DUF1778 domain-containing protein [Verminephrobacter eiseniae]